MKKNLLISVLMTIVTTVLFGLIYPLVVTGLAQLFMKDKANGQLIVENATHRWFADHRPAFLRSEVFPLASLGCRQWIRRRPIPAPPTSALRITR